MLRLASVACAYLLAFLTCVVASAPASAKRVALVVGASAYVYSPKLKNPTNDAQGISEALAGFGFDVITALDPDIAKLVTSLEAFYEKARHAEAAVFYFAGHGMQVRGVNYLIPVGAQLQSEARLKQETVALQDVISQMEERATITLAFLDACRDNPLADALQRSLVGDRSAALPRGLAPMAVRSPNTMLVFAAAPGKTASDGASLNSPFTAAMLRNIRLPDTDIELVMKRVTRDVAQATKGAQVPERLSKLTSEFMMSRSSPGAQSNPDAAAVTGSNTQELALSSNVDSWIAQADKQEYTYSEKIRMSTDLNLVREVFFKSGNERIRSIAQGRMREIERGNHEFELALNRRKETAPESWPLQDEEKRHFTARFKALLARAQTIGPQGEKKNSAVQTYYTFDDSFAGSRCASDPKFRALWNIRSRLSRFIHIFDIHRDQTEFSDLTMTRRPSVLLAWLNLIKEQKLLTKAELNKPDTRLFLSELMRYYDKITKTANWESKLEGVYRLALIGDHMTSGLGHQSPFSLEKSSPFHKAGFPAPSGWDNCLMAADYTNVSVDTWLYSFWMRRYMEGSMEMAKQAVSWGLAFSKW